MNKSEKSKEFFNDTDNYLRSNVVITLRKKIIQDLAGELSGKKIIDIGCGNGELSIDFIKSNEILFLDISANMLELVKEKIAPTYLIKARFVNSNLSVFNTNEKFDIVLCIGVAAHVEDINSLFQKLKSLMSKDGIIIFQYTASEKMISRINYFKNGLSGKNKYKYQTNKTSSAYIKDIINKNHLVISKREKYIPVAPFLSFFKPKTKLKWLFRSYKNKTINFFGSEIILLLKNA